MDGGGKLGLGEWKADGFFVCFAGHCSLLPAQLLLVQKIFAFAAKHFRLRNEISQIGRSGLRALMKTLEHAE